MKFSSELVGERIIRQFVKGKKRGDTFTSDDVHRYAREQGIRIHNTLVVRVLRTATSWRKEGNRYVWKVR